MVLITAQEVGFAALDEALRGILCRYAKSSQRTYAQVWKRWIDYHRKDPLSVTALDANRYIEQIKRIPLTGRSQRKGELPSKSTIQKQVVILHEVYKQLNDVLRLEQHNPFSALFRDYKHVKCKQVRPTQMLSTDKVMELVNAPRKHGKAGVRDCAYLALLFGAGLRRSEANKLDLKDVISERSGLALQLIDTKNGDDVKQPIANWCAEIVIELVEQRRKEGAIYGDPLFCDYSRWQATNNRRASASTMYKRLKLWCKRLGLSSNISCHSGRATAITRALDLGLDHRTVREFSRHKSVTMVETYDKRRLDFTNHPGLKIEY